MGRCLIGFDGYIDELYSVVKKRCGAEDFEKYERIEDFGNRVLLAAGKSADIEIVPCKTRFGGNGPILASALAALGYDTVCIGQMDGDVNPSPFDKMEAGCRRISTGKAAKTIALEFSDGKIMLGNLHGNRIGWQEIKDKVGEENLRRMVEESELIGIVNWSGMYRMNEILEGLYREMLLRQEGEPGRKKEIFFDLADPCARSPEDLEKLFGLLEAMASDFHVTLGMNENEAREIGRKFCKGPGTIAAAGESVRAGLKLHCLVIHTNHKIYGFKENRTEEFCGMHVEHPVQTTGAGDHFNAGFCMGLLEKRTLRECLILGQAMASFYISSGVCAGKSELETYISEYFQKRG